MSTSYAVDLALLEPDISTAVKQLPATVHTLTEHQRMVCQHAVDTLNDMLDVAKMEHGTYIPKCEIVDLGELCHKAASLQAPRLRRSVRLIMEVPPSNEAYVYSDRVLLLQFLTNLLSNAAKFTESGGVMILCKIAKIEDARVPQADEGGDSSQRGLVSVLLGVADSGPGIHPSAQEHVLKHELVELEP